MQPVQMGRFLARLRREAGLTQEALGQVLGVTNKTVSRWENGNYLPDLAMLQSIGAYFQVSVDELICGERAAAQAAPEQHTAELNAPEQVFLKRGLPGQNISEQNIPKQDASGQSAAEDPNEANTPSTRFALNERIAYWKRKWRREHIAVRAVCVLFPLLVLIWGCMHRHPLLTAGAFLLFLLLFCGARNQMMAYVEKRAFRP